MNSLYYVLRISVVPKLSGVKLEENALVARTNHQTGPQQGPITLCVAMKTTGVGPPSRPEYTDPQQTLHVGVNGVPVEYLLHI